MDTLIGSVPDSWWYIKSNLGPEGKEGDPFKNKNLPPGSWNLYGGLIEYVAHKDLFPDGLPAFHEQVGLPFVTHNRWVDLRSPEVHEQLERLASHPKFCGVRHVIQDEPDDQARDQGRQPLRVHRGE